MRGNEVLLVIVIGVVTTVIGNLIWRRIERTNSARVLTMVPKTGCGCGCS
jgi:hypothetical protein